MSEAPVKYDVNIVLVHKIPEKMEMSKKKKSKSKKVADESVKGLMGHLGINTPPRPEGSKLLLCVDMNLVFKIHNCLAMTLKNDSLQWLGEDVRWVRC